MVYWESRPDLMGFQPDTDELQSTVVEHFTNRSTKNKKKQATVSLDVVYLENCTSFLNVDSAASLSVVSVTCTPAPPILLFSS